MSGKGAEFIQVSRDLLDQELVQPGELSVREFPDHELSAGKMLVALDGQKIFHLLLPLPAGEKISEDRASSGVQIREHQLTDMGRTRRFLDVVCLKPYLFPLFVTVAGEMLDTLVADSSQPDKTCQKILNRWRDLLAAEPSGKPPVEKIVGLYGELWHLRECVKLDPLTALSVWKGPTGARHDFTNGYLSLEVKTTRSRQGRPVEIHGHTQLEPPVEGGELYLAFVRLEEAGDVHGGLSLTGLVEQLVESGADRLKLLELIALTGISPVDLAMCHEPFFTVTENTVYRVDGAFPAITSASFTGGRLPAGIISLYYQLDLVEEPPYPLVKEAVQDIYAVLSGKKLYENT